MRILHSKKLIFVSKPRCGSTSVRRLLTSKMEEGDVACDVGGQTPGLHPHMSAGAIHAYLRDQGYDPEQYYTFTITRHPLEMLWSYYKYFQPDIYGRYNYQSNHSSTARIDFTSWLTQGRVGIGFWRPHVSPQISDKDFSPLSLEAHICNNQDEIVVDDWFKVEDLGKFQDILSDIFGEHIEIPRVNSSYSEECPDIDKAIVENISKMFPMEFEAYRIL